MSNGYHCGSSITGLPEGDFNPPNRQKGLLSKGIGVGLAGWLQCGYFKKFGW